ncbi:hypothetical protein KIN20_027316 [Parelaphostrongylus tenuis]|uniref:Uncharacterized protein n=1 Tax=Parelaphostrongylus tenuis TaxID=148309 RepID=A0AAD5WDW3_PARTN|nr:hypothetical protein KIN20_027316 [Parelaphostrongylus tenuis]
MDNPAKRKSYTFYARVSESIDANSDLSLLVLLVTSQLHSKQLVGQLLVSGRLLACASGLHFQPLIELIATIKNRSSFACSVIPGLVNLAKDFSTT